ncbi:DUF1508 domain-containing protein [Nocardia thailandica]
MFTDAAGKYRWRLEAGNGEVIAPRRGYRPGTGPRRARLSGEQRPGYRRRRPHRQATPCDGWSRSVSAFRTTRFVMSIEYGATWGSREAQVGGAPARRRRRLASRERTGQGGRWQGFAIVSVRLTALPPPAAGPRSQGGSAGVSSVRWQVSKWSNAVTVAGSGGVRVCRLVMISSAVGSSGGGIVPCGTSPPTSAP